MAEAYLMNHKRKKTRNLDDSWTKIGSPYLLTGDTNAGYFGKVTSSELFTGSELSLAVGISQGTLRNDAVDWFKFFIDGKIIFRSAKQVRHAISWNTINTAGCVFGTKTVVKNNLTFKVRLMKGALTNPSMANNLDEGTHGSEWNRLMLPLVNNSNKTWTYPKYIESNLASWGTNLLTSDLNSGSFGARAWTQETSSKETNKRVIRSTNNDIEYLTYDLPTSTSTTYGWFPVLELVVPE